MTRRWVGAHLSVGCFSALVHLGLPRLGHTGRPRRALPSRNRARYQEPLLSADRPDNVTLKAVCVDDPAGFDQRDQGAACVTVLRPLLSTSRASRGKNEGVLHVLCQSVHELCRQVVKLVGVARFLAYHAVTLDRVIDVDGAPLDPDERRLCFLLF